MYPVLASLTHCEFNIILKETYVSVGTESTRETYWESVHPVLSLHTESLVLNLRGTYIKSDCWVLYQEWLKT